MTHPEPSLPPGIRRLLQVNLELEEPGTIQSALDDLRSKMSTLFPFGPPESWKAAEQRLSGALKKLQEGT